MTYQPLLYIRELIHDTISEKEMMVDDETINSTH